MVARRVCLAAVLALALPASVSRGSDDAPRLPWNPFENAVAGDWAAYRETYTASCMPGKEDRLPSWVAGTLTDFPVAEVNATEAEMNRCMRENFAFLQTNALGGGPARRVWVDDLVWPEGDGRRVASPTVEHETLVVSGARFPCWKLTEVLADPAWVCTLTVWVSPSVKVHGVVALHASRAAHDGAWHETDDFRLLGYGTRAQVLFGAARADVEKERATRRLLDRMEYYATSMTGSGSGYLYKPPGADGSDPDDPSGMKALQGLYAEWEGSKGPSFGRCPRDGWGNPIRYRCPGIAHPKGWDIYSPGPDGVSEEGGIVVGENAR